MHLDAQAFVKCIPGVTKTRTVSAALTARLSTGFVFGAWLVISFPSSGESGAFPTPARRRLPTDCTDQVIERGTVTERFFVAGRPARRDASVVQTAASGEITPAEAGDFCSLLEAQRRAIELSDIEARLFKLEAAHGVQQ